jgi:hypothetical protein
VKSSGWTVTIEMAAPHSVEAEVSQAAVVSMASSLARYAGVVSSEPGRIMATLTVVGTSPARAVAAGEVIMREAVAVAGLPRWPVVHAEVMTVEEQARQLGGLA